MSNSKSHRIGLAMFSSNSRLIGGPPDGFCVRCQPNKDDSPDTMSGYNDAE